MRILALVLCSLSLGLAQGFDNGVAAGDVTPFSAVLWAKTDRPGFVRFDLSTDPNFRGRLRRQLVWVSRSEIPATVRLRALQPGTQYYYRAARLFGQAEEGSFRTPNLPGRHHGLRFGVSGDVRGDVRPLNGIEDAAGADLDFFVNLGDTVYADIESPVLPGVPQAISLSEFRAKHDENTSLNAQAGPIVALRASTAFFATIDDHEVTNDFSGGAAPSSDPRFDLTGQFINETNLYRNGIRAFTEYHPMRAEVYGWTGERRTTFKPKLYRFRTFGLDAAMFMLDARSFRDEALPGVTDPSDPAQVGAFLQSSFDPTRTMLGRVQVDELKRDLLTSHQLGIRWKFVMVPEPMQNLGVTAASDRFEGYAAERTEILDFIQREDIRNVVFVAADIHGTVINNITYQTAPFGPQIPTAMFEVTTGSISFDAPFGPTVIGLAAALGLVPPAQLAFYQSLPPADQDAFVRTLLDTQLVPFGYDPAGLDNSLVQATLLDGNWLAVHYYGWTEFDIDATTGALTVTTRGVVPGDLTAIPTVRSRFVVQPQ